MNWAIVPGTELMQLKKIYKIRVKGVLYTISLRLAYWKSAQNRINVLTDCKRSDWSINTQGSCLNNLVDNHKSDDKRGLESHIHPIHLDSSD